MPGVRDTFWIVKGLLVSGMRRTATGMVRNLVSLAATHGHVPNGARTYYVNRSQPPLLSAMVKLLADGNGDESLLEDAFPVPAESAPVPVCSACRSRSLKLVQY